MSLKADTGLRFFAASVAAVTIVALAACGNHSRASTDAAPASPSRALILRRGTDPAPEYSQTPATALDDVLTYHNNAARTGLQPYETILTPANVNPSSFGRLFSDQVDGFVNAQPLYVAGVRIPGKGRRNVVYVATENDSVYAFDADKPGPPLWHDRLLDGGTPVTSAQVNCGQIVPRMGITGTPVIDLATNTLYVVAMIRRKEAGKAVYQQMLHALDIRTGAEKLGGPVAISASVPGTGAGSVNGRVPFDPFSYVNRAGLALSHGVVYIGFSSHCDLGNYHGWLFAYNARTLARRAVFNVTPNGSQGAIWETGDAPAIDSKGNIYVLTANGTFDAASGGKDYGDSFLKLSLEGNQLRPIDFFTPYDQQMLNVKDLDVGSGGAVLLPKQPGSHRRLIVGEGKNAVLYLVNRERMGGFNPKGNPQVVQEISGNLNANFSTPAFWDGNLYLGPLNQPLQDFRLKDGRFSPTPSCETPNPFIYPGTTPAVSSDGNKNAIVWALEDSGYLSGKPTVLYAYDAKDISNELYSSAHDSSRENADPAVKFTTPTIAHGRVYFGTEDHLDVYGLFR